MTVEMIAYHKVCHVMGSVHIPTETDLNENVVMNVDLIMNMRVQNGGHVQMAHAEISQYSVMAHYLEAVPRTRFCVDTTRGCKFCS